MKKSLLLSVLLHLVLIAIFFSLSLPVDLSKKSKAIKLTFGPPNTTSQKIPSKEESKPSPKSAPIPPVKSPVPIQPTSTIEATHPSTPTVPMQKSAHAQSESSPEIYGSMGLDSYYYNQPMEAFSPPRTTKSPTTKPQQQEMMKPSMQSSLKIPMQKSSMILTETLPTITLSIIKNMSREIAPLDTVPNTVESNGGEIFNAQQAYTQAIQQIIEQYKIYPQGNKAGTVKIKFKIGKDGTLIKVEIIESSSFETLDTAGAVLLKKIEKFQPIPDILKKDFMDIILNINYKLSEAS